jgi:NAD-dependent SIR2 family protein deacetylase
VILRKSEYVRDAIHVQIHIQHIFKSSDKARCNRLFKHRHGFSGAVAAIRKADVLIIGGTSLVVYPAAGFISYFRGSKMVLINKSETSYDGNADLVIHDPIGQVLKAATAGL